jgi:hypothetical protein
VDSLGRRGREGGAIWGAKTSDQSKVELIEWRSIDLHLIDFK